MPPPPALPPGVAASRRAVLGVPLVSLALAGTLAGCDDADSGRGSGPGVSAAAPGRAGDRDAAHVGTVRGRLREAQALVAAAVTAFPVLDAPLRPLQQLHAAHLEELDDADHPDHPDDPDEQGSDGQDPAGRAGLPRRARRDAGAALESVRSHEQQLHRHLVSTAVAVESGRLARLLACMSAGLTQALLELPTTPPPGSGA